MTIAIVVLIAVVASGRGGYAPWAAFVLEIAVAALALVGVARAFGGGSDDVRRSRYTAWRRLPFASKHPELSRCLRAVTLGRWPRERGTADVEIVLPSLQPGELVELDLGRELFVLGHPFKRTGFGAPLALMTLWIALSLVPLSRGLLALLSPSGASWRRSAEQLVGIEAPLPAAWSLVPFLSARSLWLWIAVVALFWLTVTLARRANRVRELSMGLLALGALSGAYGLAGWFEELRAAYGVGSEALRARGSFGNPNHFAAFQGMLFLVGLGWLAHFRAAGSGSTESARRRRPRDEWNESALATIAGLGLLLSALGLVLSLSRSGLTACIVGVAAFVLLTRSRSAVASKQLRGFRRRESVRAYAALALVLAGFTVWLGAEPLVGRFAELGEQWEIEGTRRVLWRDSLPAVGDFWLTGSGASTFRYVGARYRSFGGRTFFSWAHNDYLQLAIELGLPGMALLLWLLAALLRGARRARADLASSPPLRPLHAGYLSAIVAVALHSATDFSLHLPANLALLAVLAGVSVGMEAPVSRFAEEGGARAPRHPTAGSPRSRRS